MGENGLIFIFVFFNLVLVGLLVAIIIFIWQYRVKKKQHDNEILKLDELHKEELLQNEYEIQQETMKSIGREIHDSVGQKLTLATLFLHSLEPEKLPPEVAAKLKQTTDVIHESLEELRHLSKTLTDNRIDELNIAELIQAELNKIQNVQKVKFHADIDSKIYISHYQLKAVILRITQEFIQNSLKHARCENLYVNLRKDGNDIILVLKDDGKGFNVKKIKGKGIGISNIKKRTQIINGKLRLKSIPGKGTVLEIKIPHHET